MKFLILSFALAAVASAQYQTGYKDPGTFKTAGILRQVSEQSPDGSYSYSFETQDGISKSESGSLKALGPQGEPAIVAQGGYQYTAPDGQVIKVDYIAGPDGFAPVGTHLPTSPPIPEAILRSLAYNAANPQKETEYYKPEPYYTTPRPIYDAQYTTPKPYYPPVKPTFQPYFPSTFQPTYQPAPTFYNPAGRR